MDKCAKIILKQPAVFNVTNEILSNECNRVEVQYVSNIEQQKTETCK